MLHRTKATAIMATTFQRRENLGVPSLSSASPSMEDMVSSGVAGGTAWIKTVR